jgi:hypothetical protein
MMICILENKQTCMHHGRLFLNLERIKTCGGTQILVFCELDCRAEVDTWSIKD